MLGYSHIGGSVTSQLFFTTNSLFICTFGDWKSHFTKTMKQQPCMSMKDLLDFRCDDDSLILLSTNSGFYWLSR